MRILKARWIAPIDRPIIVNGAVVIAGGRIAALGESDAIRAVHGNLETEDFGCAIILPGLVNAHTHLELSNCACDSPAPASFTDWILTVRSRMKLDESDPAGAIIPATRNGVAQCIRFGVTSVGDISHFCEITRPILRDSPLRAVSFGEVLGLAKLRHRFESRLDAASDQSLQSARLTIGLSPHAPYTVDLEGYKACLALAEKRHFPLATHLAETSDEADFLRDHSGRFRTLWEKLGLWDDPVEPPWDSPLKFADAIGLLKYPTLLAHVNYCDDSDLSLLSAGNSSVVYCPRTHRYFGHPPHRFAEMTSRRVNVAVGTDSCASSPDLNLLDDLRVIRETTPDFQASSLWEMATIRGAKALSLDTQIGTLTPGKRADLIVFENPGNDPLRDILDEGLVPAQTWIEGVRVW